MVLAAGKGLENSETNARICNKVRALFSASACRQWRAVFCCGFFCLKQNSLQKRICTKYENCTIKN
jgi:hypothetical protein